MYNVPQLSAETITALKAMVLTDGQLQEALDHYEALVELMEIQVFDAKLGKKEYFLVYRDIAEKYRQLRDFKESRLSHREWKP